MITNTETKNLSRSQLVGMLASLRGIVYDLTIGVERRQVDREPTLAEARELLDLTSGGASDEDLVDGGFDMTWRWPGDAAPPRTVPKSDSKETPEAHTTVDSGAPSGLDTSKPAPGWKVATLPDGGVATHRDAGPLRDTYYDDDRYKRATADTHAFYRAESAPAVAASTATLVAERDALAEQVKRQSAALRLARTSISEWSTDCEDPDAIEATHAELAAIDAALAVPRAEMVERRERGATPTTAGWYAATMKGTSGLLCVRVYVETHRSFPDGIFAKYDGVLFSLDTFEWGLPIDAALAHAARWTAVVEGITRREAPCEEPDDVFTLLDGVTEALRALHERTT